MRTRILRAYVYRANLGYISRDGRTIYIYNSCTYVPFMWGSLRLAPIIIQLVHTCIFLKSNLEQTILFIQVLLQHFHGLFF